MSIKQKYYLFIYIAAIVSFGCSSKNNNVLFDSVRDALKGSNFEAAENKAFKLIKLNPDSDEAKKLYLTALIKRGKVKKANIFFNNHFKNNLRNSFELLYNKALLQHYAGNVDSSEYYISKAIIVADNELSLSKCYNIKGLNKFFNGQYDSARIFQETAFNYANSVNAAKEKADALRQLGVLAWYAGKLDTALIKYYKPALKLYNQCNDQIGRATTLSDIGLLYFDWKNWKKDFEYQIKAIKIRREIGDLIGLADSYYFFQHLPVSTNNIQLIKLKFIEKSLDISREIGYKWGEEVSLNALDSYYKSNHDIFISSADKIDTTLFLSTEAKLVKLMIDYSSSQYSLKPSEKRRALEKILELSEETKYEVYRFWSNYLYFNFLIEEQNFSEAEIVLKKVKDISRSHNVEKYYPEYPLIMKAALLYHSDKTFEAFEILSGLAESYDAYFKNTFRKTESFLSYASSIGQKSYSRYKVYSLLFDALYKLNNKGLIFTFADKQKKIAFIKKNAVLNGTDENFSKYLSLLSKDLSNTKFQSVCDSLFAILNRVEDEIINRSISLSKASLNTLRAPEISLPQFQKGLKNNTAYLEYLFGDKHIYLLAVTNRDSKIFKLNADKEKLKRKVSFFGKTITRGFKIPSDTFWISPSTEISEKLFSPFLNDNISAGITDLVISPSQYLENIPFGILLIKDSDKYVTLIEKFTITFSLSPSMFLSSTADTRNNSNSLLAVSPKSNLLYTSEEIEKIPENTFSHKKILLDDDATINNFINNACFFDIIHFAGHSIIDAVNPYNSSLQFTDGNLKLIDIYKLKFTPQLIILSSCNSGNKAEISNSVSNELNTVSFTRVLKEIGAKIILSTKWEINDAAASEVMNYFYNELARSDQSDLVYSTSLRAAQLKMLHSSKNRNFRHPFYWAAFFVTR